MKDRRTHMLTKAHACVCYNKIRLEKFTKCSMKSSQLLIRKIHKKEIEIFTVTELKYSQENN